MKLVALFLLFPLVVLAREKEMYAAAKSGLSLRAGQSINSNLLQKIPYGEKVVFLNYDSSLISEGFQTIWAKVRYKGKTGFVAAIYLLEIAPPLSGTETVEKYFKQLSSLACPVITIGSNDAEAEEDGLVRIEKSIYKNGFEYHVMHAYESGSSTYILPNLHLNTVFQIFRGIPEFNRFLNSSTPFPTVSKKLDKNHRITVKYFLDEQGKEDTYRIEKISFYAEDNGISELEFFENEEQSFVVFRSGV